MYKIVWILIAAIACLFVWLYMFRLFYTNAYLKNKIRLAVSSLFGIPAAYSFSVFETVLYCLFPLVGALIVGAVGRTDIGSLFIVERKSHIGIIMILAIVSAMSVTAISLMLTMTVRPSMDISTEMSKVKWIAGIYVFPRRIAWIIPMISACFEELFFRGVFLTSLVNAGLGIWIAIGIVTIAFVLNQCILADTWNQRIILGTSSIAISIVGCVAYLSCGNMIPSMIMHASFAGFYTNSNK